MRITTGRGVADLAAPVALAVAMAVSAPANAQGDTAMEAHPAHIHGGTMGTPTS